jgi:molybdenum cofactor cytidylyltransferase
MRIAGLILAAGAASRFGAPKALAHLAGRPLLEHVLATARSSGLDPIVVVLGVAADAIEGRVAWAGERRIVNPDPGRGLGSSLKLGLAAIAAEEPASDAALILLADQPRTSPGVIAALLAAGVDRHRPVAVPQYVGGGGSNPVLLDRSAFDLADSVTGDHGLGPLIRARPDLVREVPVSGTNPDVDTRADLAALAAEGWAERVRANREQVDRVREAPDGPDFYRAVSSIFRADPHRPDDPVLAALLAVIRSDDVFLDIGAGAGRYALPIALAVREVIAIDPSASMLDDLRSGIVEHDIRNVRVIQARWPEAAGELGPRSVDVALIAHVGYDIEDIGSFLDSMEAATRRLCVAILMDRSPASIAEPFWRDVHGEDRVALPALPEFLELLETRGARPDLNIVDSERRRWRDRDELEANLRRQTWVAPGGQKERRLLEAIDRRAEIGEDGTVSLGTTTRLEIGVVTWSPRSGPFPLTMQ